METAKIKKLQQNLFKALDEKRLKDAFSLLGSKLKELQNSELIDSHYSLEMSYKSILHYSAEGPSDPGRQSIFNHLLQNIYHLVDQSLKKMYVKYSGEYAYETQRTLIHQNTKLNKAFFNQLLAQYEDQNIQLGVNNQTVSQSYINLENQLFYLVWLSSEEDVTLIKSFFESDEFPIQTKSLVVSAVLLNLLNNWNLPLLLFLFDLAVNSNVQLQMKAITSLLIVLYKYDNRLFLYPEIGHRLKLLKDDSATVHLLQTIMIQFVRTMETQRISNKLQNEIIPEVIKMQPQFNEMLDLNNLTSGNFEDKNPEWSDFFSDSPDLINKLEEISKWQMEGADVFLSTFQMLKHFTFFNEFSNWFVPFYVQHPEAAAAVKNSGDLFLDSDLIDSISESGFLCNSDKYSLILSLPHMPVFQRNMMGQMFKAEIEQMSEIQKDEFSIDPTKRKLAISNQYIQDLYRFFKVHPLQRQFEDVFSWKMDFYNKWFFHHLFHESSPSRQIGEFLFKKNYFDEALEVFTHLFAQQPENVELMQKIAYCHQNQNEYAKALDYYLKADLLKPDNKWTLKKIAFCYSRLGNTALALNYYLAAAKVEPDNLLTLTSIGGCYLELHHFEEALKCYFKVEYLNPSNAKVWRPIGWCSFVLGKFDQAEKYYHKVIVNEQNKFDLINLGHIQLCKGQRKEALHYYKKSLNSTNNSMADFIQIFEHDKTHLLHHGIDLVDIPILLDQLRYSLD